MAVTGNGEEGNEITIGKAALLRLPNKFSSSCDLTGVSNANTEEKSDDGETHMRKMASKRVTMRRKGLMMRGRLQGSTAASNRRNGFEIHSTNRCPQ